MTEGWVDFLTGPWGIAFALAAGVLSFLSPCVLPLVPAYFAHLTGTTAGIEGQDRRRETVSHAVAFVGGFTAAFTIIGASVGLLAATLGAEHSGFVRDHQRTLEQVAGVVLVVLGLNLIGVIRIPLLYRTYAFDFAAQPATAGAGAASATLTMGGGGSGGGSAFGRIAGGSVNYGRSAGVGAAFAIGWTPCLGPVLGAILTLSATSADVAQGFYLLLAYSLGLGLPFIATAFAVVPITGWLRRHRRVLPVVEIAAGVMIILVGALIFLDSATLFSDDFSRIPFLDRLNEI
jgi:cytochrome c-type biogenesis protein